MSNPSLTADEPAVPSWDDEGLFARDVDGQLIRLDPVTAKEYDATVKVEIDGTPLTLPRAVPTTDFLGHIVRDSDGNTIPRATTIYDAARRTSQANHTKNPIPILCHQEHLRPVGVCRVCVVRVDRREKDRVKPGRKLVPSCQHRVEDGMLIHTMASPEFLAPDNRQGNPVKSAVKMLVELLLADYHPVPGPGKTPAPRLPAKHDELLALAAALGVSQPRFPARPRAETKVDTTSNLMHVDLNACILCNRCVRGCDEVKENNVIGKTGKGYQSRISFDLNDPMGESGCVSCGECLISCPTGALTLLPEKKIAPAAPTGSGPAAVRTPLTTQELMADPLFAGVPFKFLEWNGHGVTKRTLKPKDILYREGEPGNTAFRIVSGSVLVSIRSRRGSFGTERNPSMFSRLAGRSLQSFRGAAAPGAGGSGRSLNSLGFHTNMIRGDASMPLQGGSMSCVLAPRQILIGEMTCLNSYPRATTAEAIEPTVVLEIRKNVMLMLLRNQESRQLLNAVFRENAFQSLLLGHPLFTKLRPQDVDRLKETLRFLQVDPGQVIARQGQRCDALYILRLGFVKVGQFVYRQEIVLDYIGPGGLFGEIGVLSTVSPAVARNLPEGTPAGVHTTTYTAIDQVEVVAVDADVLRDILRTRPAVLSEIEPAALRVLAEQRDNLQPLSSATRNVTESFLDDDLGVYKGQSLLVLDLERCTRCDECTKACADTHGGVTRLIREGQRFDQYLVTTSCRSCINPTCMVGCPVDAIHRTTQRNIVIEDWCIGCGLCSDNCPFGVIHMVGQDAKERVVPADSPAAVVRKATACDLCEPLHDVKNPKDRPSCVYACPHDAAFRVNGRQLKTAVEQQTTLSAVLAADARKKKPAPPPAPKKA